VLFFIKEQTRLVYYIVKKNAKMLYSIDTYMKSLIITAHPSSKGHTHAIAHAYIESLTRRGWEYEIIDLYAPENALPLYAFENIYCLPDNQSRRLFQA
jgi:hypothetical protein